MADDLDDLGDLDDLMDGNNVDNGDKAEETDGAVEDVDDIWGDAMEEQAVTDDADAAPLESLDEIEEGAFENADTPGSENPVLSDGKYPNLEKILDLPVTLSVEIGHTEVSLRNLLQLNQGSVVELDRMAGEPLDIKVNGVLVAHGEVVVVNEKFGVRLTDVITTTERIESLKSA